MSSDRSIQTLRGLACVLLVLYHVVGAGPAFGLRVSEGALRTVNDALAAVRMPLFTVLSGFVYGLRPVGADAAGFLAGKARRLLVPMLVVGTALAAAQTWAPGANATPPDWTHLHLVPVAHLWFVESLLWVFGCVLLLERGGWLQDAPRFALAGGLAVLAYLHVRGVHWLGIDGAIYLLPYFLAGLAMQRFSLVQRGVSRRRLAAAALVALAGLAALAPPLDGVERRTAWMLLAGLSSCALLIALQPCHRGLAWLGSASYAIYLHHVFFTATARVVLESLGITSLAVHVAAGLSAGLAGPVVVRRLAAGQAWARLLLLGESRRRSAPALTLSQGRA